MNLDQLHSHYNDKYSKYGRGTGKTYKFVCEVVGNTFFYENETIYVMIPNVSHIYHVVDTFFDVCNDMGVPCSTLKHHTLRVNNTVVKFKTWYDAGYIENEKRLRGIPATHVFVNPEFIDS